MSNRDFNCSDAVYRTFVDSIMPQIEADFPKFKEFSPVFNDSYLDPIKLNLEEASLIESDNVYIDRQANETSEITKQLAVCQRIFQSKKFHIEMAFMDSPNKLNEFGFNDYRNSHRSPQLFRLFMIDYGMVCNRYKDILLANGITQEYIDSIPVETEKLRVAIVAGKTAKSDRALAADKRIDILNQIHEKLSLIMKAAKIIFMDDEYRMGIYKFPITTTNANGEEVPEEAPVNETL